MNINLFVKSLVKEECSYLSLIFWDAILNNFDFKFKQRLRFSHFQPIRLPSHSLYFQIYCKRYAPQKNKNNQIIAKYYIKVSFLCRIQMLPQEVYRGAKFTKLSLRLTSKHICTMLEQQPPNPPSGIALTESQMQHVRLYNL